MTWRDRLVPASFDGAPFFVDSMDLDQGPRAYVQKFPGTGRVEVQNLGNDAREITVNAYLLGEDYDFDRDVLEAALLEGGVKPLTLPWRGTKNVTVDQKFKTTESKSEGGYCRISFHCVEDVPEEPFSRAARPAQLEAQATVVSEAAQTDLSDRLDVSGLPSSNLTSNVTALTTATTAMRTASDRIAGVSGQINGAASAITDFADDAEALLSTPSDLATSLAGVVEASLGVATAGLAALELRDAPGREIARLTDIAIAAALGVLDFTATLIAVNEGTANGVREAANRKAITNAVKAIAVAEAARLTTSLTFESYAQASATREAFVAAFDAMLADLSDEVVDAVLLLQANLVTHLDAVASALPDLRTYTTPRMISAAEVAHDIYGDASRADEVADRNGVGNPNFIAAGTVLELLSV